VSMLYKINNTVYIQDGVNQLKELAKQYKTYGVDKYITVMLNNLLNYKKGEVEKAENTKENLDAQIISIQKVIDAIKQF
jgi:hypothetical protein